MRKSEQGDSAVVKTIVTPERQASERHLAAIEQKLQQLRTAPQARVILELNPLIMGWATYYAGIVEASTMSRYDDLVEQQLINWASKRHPGEARDRLLARYWRSNGKHGRVFATSDGRELRAYRQASILKS
jgi:RNA-directed DNA polymerase